MAAGSGAGPEATVSSGHFGNDEYIESYGKTYDQYTQTNRPNRCTSCNCVDCSGFPNKSLAIIISCCTSPGKPPPHLCIYNQVTVAPGDWG